MSVRWVMAKGRNHIYRSLEMRQWPKAVATSHAKQVMMMAGRKPARMYRQIKSQSYTRRKYMGGVPHNRITNFELGNRKGTFPMQLNLLANEACQIRHTSLEAARIAANRYIQKKTGTQGYFLKVRVYPHEVLRENKLATGAGADRVSSGMRHAFGKAVGTAARVKKNQILMSLRVNRANIEDAKKALWKAGLKISTPCRIDILDIEETAE